MPPRRAQTRNANNNQDQVNPNPDMVQLLALLQQQTATLAQQQQLLQQQLNPQQPPVVTFKTFQSVNPPKYHGDQDPVKSNGWLKEMEKAFALVNLNENQKVEFASHFLKGESN